LLKVRVTKRICINKRTENTDVNSYNSGLLRSIRLTTVADSGRGVGRPPPPRIGLSNFSASCLFLIKRLLFFSNDSFVRTIHNVFREHSSTVRQVAKGV